MRKMNVTSTHAELRDRIRRQHAWLGMQQGLSEAQHAKQVLDQAIEAYPNDAYAQTRYFFENSRLTARTGQPRPLAAATVVGYMASVHHMLDVCAYQGMVVRSLDRLQARHVVACLKHDRSFGSASDASLASRYIQLKRVLLLVNPRADLPPFKALLREFERAVEQHLMQYRTRATAAYSHHHPTV